MTGAGAPDGGGVEADLHLHSTCSDGLETPGEVVARAVAAGLRAIALTDHDTLAGVAEARRECPDGFEVMAGVEISSVWQGREVHLLAYDVDPADPDLADALARSRADRIDRAARIVERLNRLGVAITMEEITALRPDAGDPAASVGRPHIAEVIVRRGAASSVDEAFARYLRPGRSAWVPRRSLPVDRALRLVRAAGGSLVIAHPGLNLSLDQTRSLAAEGIDGIEVWHPKHDPGTRDRLARLASATRLVATGGSDYHGEGRSRGGPGTCGVPIGTIARLRDRARAARGGAGA